MSRPYNIGLGAFTCVSCGKSARKYYQPKGNHRPFCSSCINGVVGTNVAEEELSVPIWLVTLADKFVDLKLSHSQISGRPLAIEGFEDSFSKFYFGVKTDELDLNNYKINGKPVTIGWLQAIKHHMMNRRILIEANSQKAIRDDIMCPVCIKRMYYTGGIAPDGRQKGYNTYHCLSATQDCEASKFRHIYGYYHSMGVLKRLQGLENPRRSRH